MKARYNGSRQRSFKNAVIQLLEQDYSVLGSRRILTLLAEDIQTLTAQFHPTDTCVQSGYMVFTGTKVTGGKARPGASAADYPMVTLAWPVLLPEDVEVMCELAPGQQGRSQLSALYKKRLLRIVEYGLNHPQGPVTLTAADLGLMLGRNDSTISKMLKELRQETGKTLLTKGYFFDQGVRPTHKAEIVSLYEQGLDETEIARQSHHAQSSVGRYLRDYERVKLMLRHGIPSDRIGSMIDMQPAVANVYAKLAHEYHPDLNNSLHSTTPGLD